MSCSTQSPQPEEPIQHGHLLSPDMIRAMSTELFLDFLGICIDSRKAEGSTCATAKKKVRSEPGAS